MDHACSKRHAIETQVGELRFARLHFVFNSVIMSKAQCV